MKLIIDNTTRSGNFFDNINNQNYITKEYYINDMNFKEILKDIKSDSYIKVEEDIIDNNDFTNTSDKYNYINDDNLNLYETDVLNNFYSEHDLMFELSENQYYQYLVFCKEHNDCLRDKKTGRHKFGTIGGGISIVYRIYNKDKIDIYAVCHACNKNIELLDKIPENIDILKKDNKTLKEDYETFKKYHPKFNKVEFYRFSEIWKEYIEDKNEEIVISFMGTGLGDIININTKEFSYDITDTSHW